MSDDVKRVELPCSRCGMVAVSIVIAGLLDQLGAVNKLALRGAARAVGEKIDESHPSLGLDPAEISAVLKIVCIPCVDGYSSKPSAVHDEIASGAFPAGALLECVKCHQSGNVSSADCSRYLATGWPVHCGVTMMVTQVTS